jgi:hypothetical protein
MRLKLLGGAALALALLFGLLVRFRGLEAQPMLLWDEGLFATGARFLAWRLAAPDAPPEAYEGYPVFNEKPLHVLLLALVTPALGPEPLAGRRLSALFALATLLLLAARLGRLGSGLLPAALGTLALGASTYHAYYSRLGLHEIDSVFWLLLGCSLADRGVTAGRAALAGLCAGLCLGTSYRWLPLLPLLALRATAGPGKAGRHARRLLAFGLGLAAVILLCEGLYRWSFWPNYTAYQPASYLAALHSKFQRETHFVLEDWDFFLRLLYELDGPLWLAGLAGLGILAGSLAAEIRPAAAKAGARASADLQTDAAKAGARRAFTGLALECLGFTLVPLVLFSVSEAKVARAVSGIGPWLALGLGLTLHRLQPRPRLAAAFGLAAVLAAVPSCRRALALPELLQSGYPQALRYVTERSERHLSSEAPVSAALAGRRAVVWASLPRRALPATAAELLRARDEGARFLILDWEKHLWYNPLLASLESRLPPVLVVDNPCARFPALLHETYLPADAAALRARERDLDKVLVYDLRALP